MCVACKFVEKLHLRGEKFFKRVAKQNLNSYLGAIFRMNSQPS